MKRQSNHAITIVAITFLLIIFFSGSKKIGFGKGLFEIEFAKRIEKIINNSRTLRGEK